jgi:hypothetical protein
MGEMQDIRSLPHVWQATPLPPTHDRSETSTRPSQATLVPPVGRVSAFKIVKNVDCQNINLTSLDQHRIFSAGTFD